MAISKCTYGNFPLTHSVKAGNFGFMRKRFVLFVHGFTPAKCNGFPFRYSYSNSESNHFLISLKHHKKSVRCLRFAPDGTKLLSVSKDQSLQVVDMREGKVCKKIAEAHE